MINIFLLDYSSRLRSWSSLRDELIGLTIQDVCVKTDNFWQQVPLSNYYLHSDYIKDWPDPWTLISDNLFCYHARALGMIYTLLLSGINDVELVEAKDDNSNEVVLVLVDDAKYLLNYWPDTVLNIHINQFVITRRLDITPLYSKIGL